jgi:parallel beta-helix repeat protein
MAKYPNQIYEPREKENRPGVTYDPNKKTVLFAEDIKALDDEVKAIETELGTNPKGNFDSVKAFLQYLLGKVKDYFTDLLDVPHSYEGQAGKVLKVKQTEDGLEFGEAGGGGKRTATRIVAANDSLDKTGADYVCDGIADQEEINQAINDLPTSGGRVLLLEGTYNISSPITILKNNVTLEGQGAGTKLFLVNGANCNVINVGNGATALEGIRIANLRIDGNKANQTDILKGIYFLGASGYLITKSIIEGCLIENCYLYGIYWMYSDNNVITGNQVRGNAGGGIIAWFSNNNTITGNRISEGYLGISFANSNNNVITGNRIISNGSNGIELNYANNNTVTGNQINGNLNCGIGFDHANNNTITGNQINGNFDGIYISASTNNTITGNQINGNNQRGIYFSGGVNNNTITGNQVNSNRNGIFIVSSSNNTIIGNRCQGNSEYGINIYDSSSNNNLIAKNYLTQNNAGSLNDNGTGTIKGASTENDNVI